MKYECAYCGRMRKVKDEPCLGCGRIEVVEKENKFVSERFYNGYFVKSIKKPLDQSMEYFFFRGKELVDRIEIDWRNWMMLKEAEGIDDGADCFYLIWEMFENSQKEKFGVVKTYENDPKVKRVEVHLVPWRRWLGNWGGKPVYSDSDPEEVHRFNLASIGLNTK